MSHGKLERSVGFGCAMNEYFFFAGTMGRAMVACMKPVGCIWVGGAHDNLIFDLLDPPPSSSGLFPLSKPCKSRSTLPATAFTRVRLLHTDNTALTHIVFGLYAKGALRSRGHPPPRDSVYFLRAPTRVWPLCAHAQGATHQSFDNNHHRLGCGASLGYESQRA